MDLPVDIRPMAESDMSLAILKWASSARPAMQWLCKNAFRRNLAPTALRALREGTALVACAKAAPEVVHAWASSDVSQRVLHWVYVRPEFRRMGLARMLTMEIERRCDGPLRVSGWSRDGKSIIERYEYRPDLLRAHNNKRRSNEITSQQRHQRNQQERAGCESVR
jgi:GNAT superfamily N-acetyltransferase